MIDAVLYGALGFFIATLLALLFAPHLWNRAVRVTTKRIEATMPMSFSDIEIGKDQLRAEFAIELRRLEAALEKAKAKAVHELVETSKGRVRIDQLGAELAAAKARIEETESAKLALERTLNKRLPELQAEADRSNRAADEIERINVELRQRLKLQSEALREAREALRGNRAEIERLRAALQADEAPVSRLLGRSDSALVKQNRALTARLSLIEEELSLANDRNTDDYLLREEMRKLASEIVRASSPEDAAPEFVPEPAPEPSRLENRAALRRSQAAATPSSAVEPISSPPQPSPERQPVSRRSRFGRRSAKENGAVAPEPSNLSLTQRLAAHAKRERKADKAAAERADAVVAAEADRDRR